MQVSLETTQGLERKLTITLDSAKIDSAVKGRLQQLSKTQKINGFRPGKVPVSVIQKRFGAAVRQEISGEVMQRSFYEAIMKEKVTPAGSPALTLSDAAKDGEFQFIATFEVYPEVELKDLETIKIEKPAVTINEADVDEMMETLRKQHADWKSYKRKAKKDDRVTINFVGKIDGEEFEGGKADDFVLELGKDRMIPGFEKPIVGTKAGESVVVDVTFPDDYHVETLKGKAAQFDVEVTLVEGLALPKLDDAFVAQFGVSEGGVEALREEVQKNMQRELDQTVKGNVKQQVLDGLLETNQIDLPTALVDQEIDVLRKQAAERFGQQQAGNMPELPKELFEENARKRVAVGLLLGEVIKSKELKVEDARVEALIESMASAYEDPTEVVEYYKNNDEMMQQMQNVALEEQAVEVLLAQANVSDVDKAFGDIMNKQA
jgi:trigger factor